MKVSGYNCIQVKGDIFASVASLKEAGLSHLLMGTWKTIHCSCSRLLDIPDGNSGGAGKRAKELVPTNYCPIFVLGYDSAIGQYREQMLKSAIEEPIKTIFDYLSCIHEDDPWNEKKRLQNEIKFCVY